MVIVIPLGGIGKRFADLGYTDPKPLIKVLGKEIVFWVLDNLKLSKIILHSGITSAFIKFCQQALLLWNSSIEYIFKINNSIFGIACDLSPALLGVGYIVGINIGILVLIGGVISWLIAIPIYTFLYPAEGNIIEISWNI